MTDIRKLRRALRAIADITLWGEPIKDPFWKKKAIESRQYDIDADCFTPNMDTVATYLHFAVETARDALKK